jgi:hypothetical protein
MDLTFFFALLGGLLVLAFVANWLVRFTRVPDVILLMATSVLIGPVLHWLNPDIFRGATHGRTHLALIARVPKWEFMRRGINQHSLEKICRKEPVRASKIAGVVSGNRNGTIPSMIETTNVICHLRSLVRRIVPLHRSDEEEQVSSTSAFPNQSTRSFLQSFLTAA